MNKVLSAASLALLLGATSAYAQSATEMPSRHIDRTAPRGAPLASPRGIPNSPSNRGDTPSERARGGAEQGPYRTDMGPGGSRTGPQAPSANGD
jgi:hypothetical protein